LGSEMSGRESRSTIVLSERPPPDKISFKDVYSLVDRVESELGIAEKPKKEPEGSS